MWVVRILVSGLWLLLIACGDRQPANDPPSVAAQDVGYRTYGVHNDPAVSPCAQPNCIYERQPGEPADPTYPEYWVAHWNMYRVHENYVNHPPPYDDKPPPPLKAGTDYEVSKGATYYDSTWTLSRGSEPVGAMMEHYDKRCLPIFPISNRFTCSFISLGDAAYFVTYEQDRPPTMPPVCLFSKFNHPPRRDFIKHLPYSKEDSERIGPRGQGYSFWVSAATGKITQTGAAPDRTDKQDILFGYGFGFEEGGIMPQSFYFSGFPIAPANAPIVSQNYTRFEVIKPDPVQTWSQVLHLDVRTLPKCRLFNPPDPAALSQSVQKQAPTWNDIGRWKEQ